MYENSWLLLTWIILFFMAAAAGMGRDVIIQRLPLPTRLDTDMWAYMYASAHQGINIHFFGICEKHIVTPEVGSE